jgi:pimeloyl-ACP methyl ester carboxylesterase
MALATSVLVGGPPPAAQAAKASCTAETFPVRVSAVTPTYKVAGTLCRKAGATRDKTVVITAHGATYNKTYWDWPQEGQSLSLVKRLVSDVSVLNVDLLGSGDSSRPLSVHLPLDAQASMLHQLVQAMRARGFRTVILLGHSSGSGTVTVEAARYRDVDGVIVTGFLHHATVDVLLNIRGVPASFYPATLDPAFSDAGLDPGYLTTRPGTRATNGFFNVAVADPSVIAYDEAHKDVVTWLQVTEFPAIFLEPGLVSRKVNVPVLSLVGDHDGFCGTTDCPPAAQEPKSWSSAAKFELHVIPEAGHDIHLHGTSYADAESDYIRDWIARHHKRPKPPS